MEWTREQLLENAYKNLRHALFVGHWEGVDFWRREIRRLTKS